jgi:acyl-coenzyme A synthetase/AMP-(fatty) acid ligase/thioesterase domain-containing protein
MIMRSEFTRDDYINNYWGVVQQTVSECGDKEFFVTNDGAMTYAEVNKRSNVIFACLQELQKGKTGLGIGLFMKDHAKIIPAMIGILKSRNYIAPLDVNYPESTLRYVIDNAEIKIILTVDAYFDQIHSLVGDKIEIINFDKLDLKREVPDPAVNYSPDDIIQILFTSGTTGQPKGAIENYRYLGRAVFHKVFNHAFERDDRVAQLSTFAYSGFHLLVFTALALGFTIYYYDLKEEGFKDLSDGIHRHRITIYRSTSTIFRGFISTLSPDETFPSVRIAHVGSEKRLHKDIENIKKYFPSVQWLELGFASTETQAVSSTMFPIDYDFGEESLPCGKPYEDLKVFIWDEHGKPLPPDHEGEIVVYGDALVQGYINNPKLTQDRFIPDPEHPGWQYFKTGDLGKLRSDGQLVHLGRVDNMVKIRGIRIELESIENYLLSYPGIIQVTSRAFEDNNGNKRLAVYFVAEKGIQIPISDLRKYLAEHLPATVLPHYVIGLDEFPLTMSGKVATNQLPPPKMTRPTLFNEYVSPADELEKQLVSIWEEQIGVSGIGVTDDFFEVGGDSLIGALLFAAVEEVLGKNLPVSTLLIAPTIRKQAEQIRSVGQAQNYSPIIPINPQGDHAPLFFIPGKGGYPTRIRHLAKKIDPQTPVFALQDLSNGHNEQISHSIETMAAYYLAEIKKLYPLGPYVLIGESSGGKIAYEMAQQLLKTGEKVSVLAMLDTYNMEESMSKGHLEQKDVPYYEMLIRKHLNILLKSNWQGKMDYLRFYQEIGRQKVERFLGRYRGKSKKVRPIALPVNILQMEKANRQAVREYQVLPYPGRVILFKAMRGPASKNSTNGWNRVSLGELVIHSLDCYHGSILFEPAVSQVAEIIQGYLEKIPG